MSSRSTDDEIEDDAALVADGGEEIGDAALDRRRLIGGPAAGKRRAQLVADLVDRQLRFANDVARGQGVLFPVPSPACRYRFEAGEVEAWLTGWPGMLSRMVKVEPQCAA